LLLLIAVGLSLLAPAACAKTIIVTDASNGKAVTLVAGDTLVVRLVVRSALSSNEWHVVYNPNEMLQLNGSSQFSFPPHPHSSVVVGWGDFMTQDFRFTVPPSKGSFVKGAWLRFLSLSPVEPGVKGANLWQIQYTIKASH